MLIKALFVRNFRGIKHLDWYPGPGLNCLIGHGDGGKTTVLDALELVLAERHNANFDDLDFYGGSTAEPITIGVVLTGVPADFKRDDKYGLSLSGWGPNGWAEEPSESNGIEAALTLRLTVDSTLEPKWSIFVRRSGQEDLSKSIAFPDRKLFGTARLGTYSDRHLSWGRGSSLQQVGAHPEQLPSTLNALARDARKNFGAAASGAFAETLKVVKPDIKKLGVRLSGELQANIDRAALSLNASGVSLHDGDVPLRCAGTGSARLAVAALQSAQAANRQFLLVDELEFGLEPHRISLLVSHLRQRTAASGQAFLTTHSPVVLREVRFGEVHVCKRNGSGKLTIMQACDGEPVSLESRRYVRDKGEALLARSVLVCEGQTEVALLKGFASTCSPDFQSLGVVFQDGGGDEAYKVALHFAKMGYRTALLTDSDKPLPKGVDSELAANCVRHFSWGNGKCTEVELFTGTSLSLRQSLLKLIAEDVEERRLLGEFGGAVARSNLTLQDALDCLADDNLCISVGTQANHKKWIKTNFDLCFRVGEKVLGQVPLVETSGTCLKHVSDLSAWMNHA
ncbi:conserved hypothetical protein [Cupriavidus taiwanensis]|uniref:Uncharacterized protein n=1 Tax=Cupriavidus taiwanensis TaxID=164546 RepID=A0A375JGB7_9BURK|nr:AAA family ATPase [Cupriavidus taiwanensis]SPS03053.1 conserved hypothetical protein [Cupriavidus taiwanensis]